MMYLESRDDKYLSYFLCTDEVKEELKRVVNENKMRVNFSNVEFKNFAIVGAESKEDSFVITTEVAVFSMDIGSVTIGGRPLSIGVQKVYTVEYTVYKDTYKCCLDCNLVLDGGSCECGGSNIKELNKKLISKVVDKKGE